MNRKADIHLENPCAYVIIGLYGSEVDFLDHTEDPPVIPPLHDVMLSTIFENMETAEAAKSLVNAVFSDADRETVDQITSLRCQSTYMGQYVKGRSCRLDVTAKAHGNMVNIEVHRFHRQSIIDRSLFYGSAILHESLRRSEKFSAMPIVSLINIFEKQIVRPSHPDYHQPVQLTYVKGDREAASQKFFMSNLELEKFDQDAFDIENALERWMFFFKAGYRMPEAKITKEVLSMDAGLQQFAAKYNISMLDPDLQMRYLQFHMA